MAGKEKKSSNAPSWQAGFDEIIEDIKKRLDESANKVTFLKDEFGKIESKKNILSRGLGGDEEAKKEAKKEACGYFDRKFGEIITTSLDELGYSEAFREVFIKYEGAISVAYGAVLAESNNPNEPVLQELDKVGFTSLMAVDGLRTVGLPIKQEHIKILLERIDATLEIQSIKDKKERENGKKSLQTGVLENLAGIDSDDSDIRQAHSDICKQFAKTYKLSPEQKIKLANKLGDIEWGVGILKSNKKTRATSDVVLVAKLMTSPLVNEQQLGELTELVKKSMKKDKDQFNKNPTKEKNKKKIEDFDRNNIITNLIIGYVYWGNPEKIQELATWYPDDLATQYINNASSLALFKAIESGSLEVVQTLVSLGANVNTIQDSLITGKNFPLKAAFGSKNKEIFECLADMGAVCRVKEENEEIQGKLQKYYKTNPIAKTLADNVNIMLGNVSKELDNLDAKKDTKEIDKIKNKNPNVIQNKDLLPVYIEAAKEIIAKTPAKKAAPEKSKRKKIQKKLSFWNVGEQPKVEDEGYVQQSTLLPQEQDTDSLSVTIVSKICESLPAIAENEPQVNKLQGIIAECLSACEITSIGEGQPFDQLAGYFKDRITTDKHGINVKKTKEALKEVSTRKLLADAFGDALDITYKEDKAKTTELPATQQFSLTKLQVSESLDNLRHMDKHPKKEGYTKISKTPSQSRANLHTDKHPKKSSGGKFTKAGNNYDKDHQQRMIGKREKTAGKPSGRE